MNRRLWIPLVLVGAVLAAYVGATRSNPGPPLDPDSTAPDGTRALVELLDRYGPGVELVDGVPSAAFDTALLLEDRLDRDDARQLEGWVRRGNLLVVADPTSLLTPAVAGAAVDRVTGGCPVPALDGVRELEAGTSRSYRVDASGTACFPTADGAAFVVATPLGEGSVVAVGGADPFTNRHLDAADNAVFVVGLLGGADRRAALLRPPVAGGGDRGLSDLVETPARAALAQLLVVFGFVVLWRARRLGGPVVEPEPVRVHGAELTAAVGRLLQSNRRPDRAAAVLRDRSRRDLSGPLGLPLDAPSALVVSTIAARTGLDEHEARRAVSDPVTTDDLLLEVAALLTRIREELTHDRSPAQH